MNWPSRRAFIIAGTVVLAVATAIGGRLAITRLDFFKIHLVEVVGSRYLENDRLVAELGIPEDASILLPLTPVVEAASSMSGVLDAKVSRRWPGTLIVTVTEAAPVALAMVEDRLRVIDENGEVLPYSPSRVAESLPLVEQDSQTAGLLARLRSADPKWYSAFELADDRGSTVRLIAGSQSIEVRKDAGVELLRTVAAVRQWLDRSSRQWNHLDARFHGRIFVRKDEA